MLLGWGTCGGSPTCAIGMEEVSIDSVPLNIFLSSGVYNSATPPVPVVLEETAASNFDINQKYRI